MEKWKRSTRLVDLTEQLLSKPYHLFPLPTFAKQYGSAKSSISEDLNILHEVLKKQGKGYLETVAGASGGVRYIPAISRERAEEILRVLCERLEEQERILPGGFLYLSDILGDTAFVNQLGKLFATVFVGKEIDAIMTVETKGIPIAFATASFLNLPVVIVRYDYRVTEGSVVTVNTISGSSKRIRPLSLSKRSLSEGSRVLVIDDFMKAGGTVYGMMKLLEEFQAEIVGVGVMVETAAEERLIDTYISLASVQEIDVKDQRIHVEVGNLFHQVEEWPC